MHAGSLRFTSWFRVHRAQGLPRLTPCALLRVPSEENQSINPVLQCPIDLSEELLLLHVVGILVGNSLTGYSVDDRLDNGLGCAHTQRARSA